MNKSKLTFGPLLQGAELYFMYLFEGTKRGMEWLNYVTFLIDDFLLTMFIVESMCSVA